MTFRLLRHKTYIVPRRIFFSIRNMSSSRPYIQHDDLARLLKAKKEGDNTVAIVDVRDDDFEGGNIPGCLHIPSSEFADKVNELVLSPLQNTQQVVFHCSLSQARGPKAARLYSEAREQAIKSGKLNASQEQKVSILRDGFAGFGPKYKDDAKLVEKWDEDSWKYR